MVLKIDIPEKLLPFFEQPKSNLIQNIPYFQTRLARYINHSNNPNCMICFDRNTYCTLIAVKDILKDEEITVDYNPL
jgi:hypothetical protein